MNIHSRSYYGLHPALGGRFFRLPPRLKFSKELKERRAEEAASGTEPGAGRTAEAQSRDPAGAQSHTPSNVFFQCSCSFFFTPHLMIMVAEIESVAFGPFGNSKTNCPSLEQEQSQGPRLSTWPTIPTGPTKHFSGSPRPTAPPWMANTGKRCESKGIRYGNQVQPGTPYPTRNTWMLPNMAVEILSIANGCWWKHDQTMTFRDWPCQSCYAQALLQDIPTFLCLYRLENKKRHKTLSTCFLVFSIKQREKKAKTCVPGLPATLSVPLLPPAPFWSATRRAGLTRRHGHHAAPRPPWRVGHCAGSAHSGR